MIEALASASASVDREVIRMSEVTGAHDTVFLSPVGRLVLRRVDSQRAYTRLMSIPELMEISEPRISGTRAVLLRAILL